MLTPTGWDWGPSHITRVIDGDTIDARLVVDIGFHREVSGIQRLRLARIDAHTGSTPRGKAATLELRRLTLGPVQVVTLKPYKYGNEWMAELFTADGKSINDMLVAGGHAVYWDGKGTRPSSTPSPT